MDYEVNLPSWLEGMCGRDAADFALWVNELSVDCRLAWLAFENELCGYEPYDQEEER